MTGPEFRGHPRDSGRVRTYGTTRVPRRTSRTRIAAVATAALAATAIGLGGADTAPADTAALERGDIALTTAGGLFDGGAGVDRLDPLSLQRSRVPSFKVLQDSKVNDVVGAGNGDLHVWGWDDTISKINHVTGEHAEVFRSRSRIYDVAIDHDGTLLLLVSDSSGFAVQHVDDDHHATTISRDGFLTDGDNAEGIQALSDGRTVVVGTSSGLVEIVRQTGAQERVSTSHAPARTTDTDGTVYFVTAPQGQQPWVKKFACDDPDHISNGRRGAATPTSAT